eukprot:scaffold72851_cov19-Tisochrysis_lutea.AAC.1
MFASGNLMLVIPKLCLTLGCLFAATVTGFAQTCPRSPPSCTICNVCSAGRRGASTCACSVCGMGATAPSHGGLEVHSSHRVLQSGIAHWLCLTLPQVISILHHHMSNHHATGEYVPTDFFETAAMLVTLVLCGKYLVSAPGSERVLKDHARVQAQQANAFGLGCRS